MGVDKRKQSVKYDRITLEETSIVKVFSTLWSLYGIADQKPSKRGGERVN